MWHWWIQCSSKTSLSVWCRTQLHLICLCCDLVHTRTFSISSALIYLMLETLASSTFHCLTHSHTRSHCYLQTTWMPFFLQQDPNSSIHFSYFSRSAADTDLDTFFRADSKSSMVVGMCISSREMLRISSGVRPSILRLMAIREASLQRYRTLTFKHPGLFMTQISQNTPEIFATLTLFTVCLQSFKLYWFSTRNPPYNRWTVNRTKCECIQFLSKKLPSISPESIFFFSLAEFEVRHGAHLLTLLWTVWSSCETNQL